MTQVANSSRSGKLDYTGTRQLLMKHIPNNIAIGHAVGPHAYIYGVMASMLELARTTSFECGLFAAHLAGVCIEHGIDVSYNHCFPGQRNAWEHMPFLWYDKKNKHAKVFLNM